jgi:hypothetical protein
MQDDHYFPQVLQYMAFLGSESPVEALRLAKVSMPGVVENVLLKRTFEDMDYVLILQSCWSIPPQQPATDGSQA